MTTISTYTTGGKTYTITEDRDGNIERNGCPVRENRNGRRYVLTHQRRKKYLCECRDCYKNARIGSLCRDHSPNYTPKPKPKPGSADPWAGFGRVEEEPNESRPAQKPPQATNWEDIAASDDPWW